MKITFLGGASAIGASSALCEVAGKCFLVDCGVRFEPTAPLPHLAGLEGKSVDAILVTHAHSDHTGGLPLAHLACPGAPVLMTPPTVDLTRVLFKDALKLMDCAERETELPLYRQADVESLFEAITPVQWGDVTRFGDVEIRYLPASHILGASMIHMATPEGHVLWSGDFSVTGQHTVDGLSLTNLPVDVLICESTYGNRLHSDRRATEKMLVQKVGSVFEKKGRVLIPAFALGRAQEVLLILKRAIAEGLLPEFPIFADGMVRSMCQVYGQHERFLSKPLQKATRTRKSLFFEGAVRSVNSLVDRKAVLEAGPCAIVASSGMLTGGPSAFYASHLAQRKEDAIFLSGYQDEESPGRALLKLLNETKDRFLNLPSGRVPLNCQLGAYSLSAHSDAQQTLAFITKLSPKTVILVHGDSDARTSLQQNLEFKDVVLGTEGTCIERSFRARSLPELNLFKPLPAYTIAAEKLKFVESKAPSPVAVLQTRCEALWIPYPAWDQVQGVLSFELLNERFEGVGENPAARQADASQKALAFFARPEFLEHAYFQMRKILSEKDATTVGLQNPKGTLLERLTALGQSQTPSMFRAAMGPAHDRKHAAWGSLEIQTPEGQPGRTLTSRVWISSRLKTSEAGVCSDLLEQFDEAVKTRAPVLQPSKTEEKEFSEKNCQTLRRTVRDPKMLLHEVRQKGELQEFGYHVVAQTGFVHAPRFTMTGHALLASGERLKTQEFQAKSKKEGESLCAEALWQILQFSITRDRKFVANSASFSGVNPNC